jgi:hypothetical protein
VRLSLAQYLELEARRKLARNPVKDSGEVAKLESDSSLPSLDSEKVQRPTGKRFLVRVESVRKRLLDPDNLCEKYHVDLLRYCGAIPGDTPQQIDLETSQRKAEKGEEEHTLIEVYRI